MLSIAPGNCSIVFKENEKECKFIVIMFIQLLLESMFVLRPAILASTTTSLVVNQVFSESDCTIDAPVLYLQLQQTPPVKLRFKYHLPIWLKIINLYLISLLCNTIIHVQYLISIYFFYPEHLFFDKIYS